ncbi:MAG: hypothetical protein U1E17_06080 [Geminicoccaceae bacterium]
MWRALRSPAGHGGGTGTAHPAQARSFPAALAGAEAWAWPSCPAGRHPAWPADRGHGAVAGSSHLPARGAASASARLKGWQGRVTALDQLGDGPVHDGAHALRGEVGGRPFNVQSETVRGGVGATMRRVPTRPASTSSRTAEGERIRQPTPLHELLICGQAVDLGRDVEHHLGLRAPPSRCARAARAAARQDQRQLRHLGERDLARGGTPAGRRCTVLSLSGVSSAPS